MLIIVLFWFDKSFCFVEVLKAHHRKSSHNEKVLPYVAIVHVRDMLIPPSERLARRNNIINFVYIYLHFKGQN